MTAKPNIPVLAGLTASGKSALALELAQHFPLEIISADAMQVYQGMNIGTAKASPAEQERVPHHLIDIISPAESFNVAQWAAAAEVCIDEIRARNHIPLVVGGTGFYIHALQRGLPTVPAADMEVQKPLWQRFEAEGIEPLLAELSAVAPDDATRCQRNPRRIIRALEIIQRTGKAPSSFPFTTPKFKLQVVAILPEVAIIKAKIEQRVDRMLERGLVAEVEKLLADYPQQPTALQAIGYKEIAAYLQNKCSLAEASAQIKLASVQYAKRQRTWCKKVEGIIMVEDAAAAQSILEEILDDLSLELI